MWQKQWVNWPIDFSRFASSLWRPDNNNNNNNKASQKKKEKKSSLLDVQLDRTAPQRCCDANNGTRLFLSHLYATTMSSVWRPVNAAANRSDTDLLRPAHRQGVVVIRLLGVVIRAHFVDIESHIVPLFVSSRPARQRTQDHDAVQPHCLLPAALSVSSSQLHVPDGGGG